MIISQERTKILLLLINCLQHKIHSAGRNVPTYLEWMFMLLRCATTNKISVA